MKVGQRTNIAWDVPHDDNYHGVVISADKLGVVVEFDNEPGAGLKKRQRFTWRRSGRLIAAKWHWTAGIPVLVAEAPNDPAQPPPRHGESSNG